MTPWPRYLVTLGLPISGAAKRGKWLLFAGLLVLLLGAFVFELTPLHGLVLCPLRATTGMECAGCGLTRSWMAMAHGTWSASWAAHPYGPILFAAAVCKEVFLGVELASGRHVVVPGWLRIRTVVLALALLALVGLGVLRAARFLLAT